MILARAFSRTELGDLLSGRLRSSAVQLAAPTELLNTNLEFAAAVWPGDGTQSRYDLPRLIVTHPGQTEHLLAWAVTYSPVIRPITAYCRVVGVDDFEVHLRSWRKPRLLGIELASVGAVLGELLSADVAFERVSRGDITGAALLSSLVFALMREAALYDIQPREASVAKSWARVRNITLQPRRNLQAEDVASIAMILRYLAEGNGAPYGVPSRVFDWCRSVMRRRPLGDSPLAEFDDVLLSGTREERVIAFDQMSRTIATSNISALEGSFLLGYLASSILPGSMRYATLLRPFIDRFTTAMVWLGVCAGFNEDSKVVSEFSGVARRVLRDLLVPEDLIDFPRCDIAIAELEILLGGDRRVEDFVRSVPSHLTVELIPGVQTSVNWPPKRSNTPVETATPAPVVPAPVTESASGLDRGALLRQLEGIQSQLEQLMRSVGGSSAPAGDSQRELFSAGAAKRPRKK
ncbi:MAG: hypothetical protein JNJ46_27455 [Myxococcales bacterium]|nr:hypothetical protein [Myxococcales bacterium]